MSALNNVALKGSDTLEHVTKDVLLACPNATSNGISYIGTGSTAGGNAMSAAVPTQNVSPQSRALSKAEGCAHNSGTTAEGLVIALDGLSITAAAATAGTPGTAGTTCGGRLAFSNARSFVVTDRNGNGSVDCAGNTCPGGVYTVADWRDVLALIYAGKHNDPAGTRDCNSDARRSLVATWGNLFQDACNGGHCPEGLKAAWRRADLSGTTDTFLSLVGLGSMPLAKTVTGAKAKGIDFCNAWAGAPPPSEATCTATPTTPGCRFGGDSDYLDLDPIRIPCSTAQEVCGRTGDLGLVITVDVPTGKKPDGTDITQADAYYLDSAGNPRLCASGRFKLMPPIAGTIPTDFRCPNGLRTLFQKCFQPIIPIAGTTDGDAACIARDFPVQGFATNGITHGGVYNLNLKAANGNYLIDTLGRRIEGIKHQMHTTETIVAGATKCTKQSATDQIGCFTQANSCTIGFAGREGVTSTPGVVGLLVNNVPDEVANIQNLVTNAGPKYPLARKLYFNSIKGFMDPVQQTGEYELAKCMSKGAIVDSIVTNRGFVAIPAFGTHAGGPFCEDFNEVAQGCAGAGPTNVDACADNVF